MKVLFNTPAPTLRGGPPTHLPLLESGLREKVDLIPFHFGRRSDSEMTFQKLWARLRDLYDVQKLLKRTSPDVIHLNSAYDYRALVRDAALAWLARRHEIPLFIKFHGSIDNLSEIDNRFLEYLRQLLFRSGCWFGVLSEREKMDFVDAWPALAEQFVVVKNIISDDFFRVARNESSEPRFLFVSRLLRKKGLFDFFHAIPRVIKELPSTRFIVIGDGDDQTEFAQVLEESECRSSIEWFGHVDNNQMADLYAKAWALVFPTHLPEGMPMVVAEAMAAGVPIITTRTRFSLSYHKEETHCLFVPIGDVGALAKQVIRVAHDAEVRSRMARENKSLAGAFQRETVVNEYLSIYDQMAGKSTGGGLSSDV